MIFSCIFLYFHYFSFMYLFRYFFSLSHHLISVCVYSVDSDSLNVCFGTFLCAFINLHFTIFTYVSIFLFLFILFSLLHFPARLLTFLRPTSSLFTSLISSVWQRPSLVFIASTTTGIVNTSLLYFGAASPSIYACFGWRKILISFAHLTSSHSGV